MVETYETSGVDIAAGEEAVRRIKEHVSSTFRPEAIGDIGGFGGLFDFTRHGYKKPVLVSTTDGVGTKAFVAAAAGRFNTIGIDLVAMCVDDLVCQGAEPLFFLDYISVQKLDPERIEQLVVGVVEGCRQAGCALIGGEMAEHPVDEPDDEFELVGFAVGVVERSRLITGTEVRPGDTLIGLPSPGLRSNGYSLARRLYFEVAERGLDDPAWEGSSHSVADELLLPSVIYAPAVLAMLAKVDAKAIAHVTGGGIGGNLARVLPDKVDAVVDRSGWEQPPVFAELQRIGDVADEEMAKVFNLGLGMILAVRDKDATKAIDLLRTGGHRATVVGEVEKGDGQVRLVGEPDLADLS
ncbi:MAG: phosphoribosylformylglycinamidine cyclo-ligase [Acidimicrobiia bacterium]|nr:phosphoribosylformylglycinamidine cyclo-ligase [Acidimicrobiia bacterium]MYB09172.1 phosphoribosylformylglycinamidine cyclo-ligase [Acidimicrobiia bacterium]MYG57578.1 phosphoribosylformylglycinamidine cyclo-ligase [Acidimicrobiia bacterium]MYG71804.1 phosphoribosylformylglycinamidine cyclo-ligase [Acidimicrobiia bacterium]MYJ31241.1 phosphoribosylformylglycinamidine cyclo-ligase [Acidimicrobiia bacterium]